MADDPAQKRVDIAEDLAAGLGWDTGARSLAHEIRTMLLASVADQGTGIDSGGGDGNADLWVTVQGVKYYINIRHSNTQLLKDGKSLSKT